MKTELYLSRAEVEDLTDRQTKPAQEKRLRELGIPFIEGRPPKVLRSVALKRGGAEPETTPAGAGTEPDFSVWG